MHWLYVCRAVDERNRAVAVQVRWIAALASTAGIERVTVVTPRHGVADLPANVTVVAVGRGRTPLVALRFWRAVLRAHRSRRIDVAFVCQGGWWPVLLLPLKRVLRFRLHQWKAQPLVSRGMRFCARRCDDLVFTATPGSFALDGAEVRVVGHGIDAAAFAPDGSEPDRDALLLGRIAPGKRIEDAIDAVALLRDRGATVHLDVVGPCAEANLGYRDGLVARIGSLGLTDRVRVLPPVDYDDAPALVRRYRVSLNTSVTAFDKVAGESMAAGVPVVTTNVHAADVLPPDLLDRLATPAGDAAALADAVAGVVALPPAERAALGARLRAVVLADHGLDALFGKVVAADATWQGRVSR